MFSHKVTCVCVCVCVDGCGGGVVPESLRLKNSSHLHIWRPAAAAALGPEDHLVQKSAVAPAPL